MDDVTTAIDWSIGERTVRWKGPAGVIEKVYDEPPQSACYVPDPPSVVVVEFMERAPAISNAVVFDLDGSERLRLKPPDLPDPVGFDQVFVSRAGVVAVFVTRRADYQGEPDLLSGELRNVHEWR